MVKLIFLSVENLMLYHPQIVSTFPGHRTASPKFQSFFNFPMRKNLPKREEKIRENSSCSSCSGSFFPIGLVAETAGITFKFCSSSYFIDNSGMVINFVCRPLADGFLLDVVLFAHFH